MCVCVCDEPFHFLYTRTYTHKHLKCQHSFRGIFEFQITRPFSFFLSLPLSFPKPHAFQYRPRYACVRAVACRRSPNLFFFLFFIFPPHSKTTRNCFFFFYRISYFPPKSIVGERKKEKKRKTISQCVHLLTVKLCHFFFHFFWSWSKWRRF